MSRCEHRLAASRRIPTPVWAVNDRLCADVLVAYWEAKIGPRDRLTTGSVKERLQHAHAVLLAGVPALLKLLTERCHEFVAEQDSAKRQRLARLVRELDTHIICTRRGPSATLGIIWRYYRKGENTTCIGESLKIQPVHVRQILHRLHVLWQRLEVQKMDKKATVAE